MQLMSMLPVILILIPLVAAFLISRSGSTPNLREFWTFSAGILNVFLLFKMVPWILEGNVYSLTLCQILPDVSLFIKVDSFGMLFAFIASSLWILTSLYSIGYMRSLKEHAQTRYFLFFAVAISATLGVAFSGNLLTMYMFYELLSLSTFPLVTHHQDQEARKGGRTYLTYLLGTSIGFALPAIIITYAMTGTLAFDSAGILPSSLSAAGGLGLLLLFLFGFSKAGLMPFHSWLPGAMVAPTPVSALLHAVAVVKVGVFCLLRIITGVFGVDLLSQTQLSTVICVISGITVIVSSLIALSQDNLKRRLAFSTIGQLSYIVLGAGLASKMGVVGSMSHIGMHAFGKITLFFCAGAIYVATGKKYISQMRGIGKKMPFTMLAFFLGALSVTGIPFTGGMISKWYMLLGTMEADKAWVLVIYLVSTLLNAAYFFPIVYNAFFCREKDALFKGRMKEAPLPALLPPLVTAVSCVLLFFFPSSLFDFARVMGALL